MKYVFLISNKDYHILKKKKLPEANVQFYPILLFPDVYENLDSYFQLSQRLTIDFQIYVMKSQKIYSH